MTPDPTPTDHPGRARRADAGTVRCSQRDLELLRVVAEQYALTLPQLARMMSCSTHAARWLRSRWERAGWARGRALLVGEPVFVWLTRRGQSLAGVDYAVWRPTAGMLAHIAAVTDVRLHVLDRHSDAEWVCERELHRELGGAPGVRQRHRPDGLVVIDGREVAVEVELTLKRRARRSWPSSLLATARSPTSPRRPHGERSDESRPRSVAAAFRSSTCRRRQNDERRDPSLRALRGQPDAVPRDVRDRVRRLHQCAGGRPGDRAGARRAPGPDRVRAPGGARDRMDRLRAERRPDRDAPSRTRGRAGRRARASPRGARGGMALRPDLVAARRPAVLRRGARHRPVSPALGRGAARARRAPRRTRPRTRTRRAQGAASARRRRGPARRALLRTRPAHLRRSRAPRPPGESADAAVAPAAHGARDRRAGLGQDHHARPSRLRRGDHQRLASHRD